MKCSFSEEILTRYAEKMLSEKEAETVKSHIASCESCREYVLALSALREEFSVIEHKERNDAFWQELKASTLERVEKERSSFWHKLFFSVRRPALGAAVMMLLCAVLVLNVFNKNDISVSNHKNGLTEYEIDMVLMGSEYAEPEAPEAYAPEAYVVFNDIEEKVASVFTPESMRLSIDEKEDAVFSEEDYFYLELFDAADLIKTIQYSGG